MSIDLTIMESQYGLWRICSGSSVLFDELHFAHAIRLARGLAREQYVNTGRTVRVEMSSTEFTIMLAQYGSSPGPSGVLLARPDSPSVREQCRDAVPQPRDGDLRYAGQPGYSGRSSPRCAAAVRNA
jgi:hypothetical protein